MVCAFTPVRARYFASPRDWEVEEEEAPNGGLFSFSEVLPRLPRLVEAPEWTEGRGWFYPVTFFDLTPGISRSMLLFARFFRRAGVHATTESIQRLMYWFRSLGY